MRSGVKVLVVTADRALRMSLAHLLRLEADMEVWDCSPREAEAMLAHVDPDVVLTSDRFAPSGRRVIPLDGLAPYDSLLRELREAV